MSPRTQGDERAAKKDRETRKRAATERRHLRSELLGVLGDVGSLVLKEHSTRIAAESPTVGAFVRGIATALEGEDGTGHQGSVTVLGSLSDLARMRMVGAEQAMPFETPSDILRWFAVYLERTLDKPALRMG